jgi:hypothetical protein
LELDNLEQEGGIRLDGVIGSALIAEFRASLVDQGRTLWLEEMPLPDAQPAALAPPASDAVDSAAVDSAAPKPGPPKGSAPAPSPAGGIPVKPAAPKDGDVPVSRNLGTEP